MKNYELILWNNVKFMFETNSFDSDEIEKFINNDFKKVMNEFKWNVNNIQSDIIISSDCEIKDGNPFGLK